METDTLHTIIHCTRDAQIACFDAGLKITTAFGEKRYDSLLESLHVAEAKIAAAIRLVKTKG